MFKHRLAVTIVTAAAVACGSTSGTGLNEGAAELTEPLTATAVTGSVYRLNNASFDFFDNSGNRVATIKPTPTETLADVKLKPGNYRIALSPGWILQRQVDNGWVDMTATLTALPMDDFWIHPDEVLPLGFSFSAGFNTGAKTDTTPFSFDGGATPGSTGTARIAIDVDDCGLYVAKITSLASFTIDCLGTLDATQYSLAPDGLVKNFTSCTTGNPTALASINGLLSLQHERPDLVAKYPKAARDVAINQAYSYQCIAGAWDKWRASFATSGVNVCPTWQRLATQNPPETGVAAVVAVGLPAPVMDKKTKISTVGGAAPSLVEMQKVTQLYQVAFPAGSPAQSCGTAAQCAAACAGGFKGFVMSTNGTNQVTTDPPYWELGDQYKAEANPYLLKTNYYHLMADYGPVPGDQFGHGQRALAVQDKAGNWTGEPCTYYLNGTRFYTKLIYNNSSTGAVSWCRPPL